MKYELRAAVLVPDGKKEDGKRKQLDVTEVVEVSNRREAVKFLREKLEKKFPDGEVHVLSAEPAK